ncbi:Hypothetical predicted protein [Pelobates cultripes]|uniref:Uncharacterized protein n=1 Tax=Pelobates cultripes TaxID=61616 RepID=A0AAD1VZ43_PELCU|nr:Hypothetical predicted protein [Pelobates cultripes]
MIDFSGSHSPLQHPRFSSDYQSSPPFQKHCLAHRYEPLRQPGSSILHKPPAWYLQPASVEGNGEMNEVGSEMDSRSVGNPSTREEEQSFRLPQQSYNTETHQLNPHLFYTLMRLWSYSQIDLMANAHNNQVQVYSSKTLRE